MAIYRKDTASNNKQELRLQELPIYGSSRVGIYKPDIKIPLAIINSGSNITTIDYTGVTGAATGIITHSTNLYSNIIYHGSTAMTPTNLAQHQNTGAYYTVTRGNKQYELCNHTSNILATISDRKIPHETTTGSGIIGYYTADIVSAQDYYCFGQEMPNRTFNPDKYKFGFGGHEKDDELSGIIGADYDFGGYGYDALTLRRKVPDPMTKKYPGESPYSVAGNNPIYFIDKSGKIKTTHLIINGSDGKEIANTTTVDANYIKEVSKYHSMDIGLMKGESENVGWHTTANDVQQKVEKQNSNANSTKYIKLDSSVGLRGDSQAVYAGGRLVFKGSSKNLNFFYNKNNIH